MLKTCVWIIHIYIYIYVCFLFSPPKNTSAGWYGHGACSMVYVLQVVDWIYTNSYFVNPCKFPWFLLNSLTMCFIPIDVFCYQLLAIPMGVFFNAFWILSISLWSPIGCLLTSFDSYWCPFGILLIPIGFLLNSDWFLLISFGFLLISF